MTENETFRIDFTDWQGEHHAEMVLPVECDLEFKRAVIEFLSQLDDHPAMSACFKTWGIETDEDMKEFLG